MQLKSQGGNGKFLFPSFKAELQAEEAGRLGRVNEATPYDKALPYHVGLKTRNDCCFIPEPMENKKIIFLQNLDSNSKMLLELG